MTVNMFRSKLGFNGVSGEGVEGVKSREQKAAKTGGRQKEVGTAQRGQNGWSNQRRERRKWNWRRSEFK